MRKMDSYSELMLLSVCGTVITVAIIIACTIGFAIDRSIELKQSQTQTELEQTQERMKSVPWYKKGREAD